MSRKSIATSLFALFALCAGSLVAHADFDPGRATSSTPYDRYLSPVKLVLTSLRGEEAGLAEVRQLLRTGYGFRYEFTEPYVAQLPAVTAQTRTGDCKAKSLWLADRLGDRNVRFVIGKATRKSKISHAWLMWNDGARWWILDPTNESRPIKAERVSRNEYIPLYSYDARGDSYRHGSTATVAVVAAGKSSAVASQGQSGRGRR